MARANEKLKPSQNHGSWRSPSKLGSFRQKGKIEKLNDVLFASCMPVLHQNFDEGLTLAVHH